MFYVQYEFVWPLVNNHTVATNKLVFVVFQLGQFVWLNQADINNNTYTYMYTHTTLSINKYLFTENTPTTFIFAFTKVLFVPLFI